MDFINNFYINNNNTVVGHTAVGTLSFHRGRRRIDWPAEWVL
jgi:hypothetical protein